MSHRLYFSHSYDLKDLPFNEHLWKLLMAAGFHTWIDTGREAVPAANTAQSGAVRPMDISFNEWMMSRCDGFVAIAPSKRQSVYQLLEYRIAARMGVPRLVALQEGGTFYAPTSEIVKLPTSWKLYWEDETQSKIKKRIAAFSAFVKKHKAAGELLRSIGRWRSRKDVGTLTVALLSPRGGSDEWDEIQRLVQRGEREIQWTLIPPGNIQSEEELLRSEFDLLVVDVGPRGTPQELLGYIHALGVPQIRLCRVENEHEEGELSRFLDPEERRSMYEQDPPNTPHLASIPRFLDGSRLDDKMQPVVFWARPKQAADQILGTMRRVLIFGSGLSPKKGGTAEKIYTQESAKNISVCTISAHHVALSLSASPGTVRHRSWLTG